jgi:hypothetical protein
MNKALFQKHYEENLALLPEISQKALRSFNWVSVLLDIGKSYALQLDELEDLQVETMMLLVGVVSPDEYETEMTKILPVSRVEIDKLLDEVNTKILAPIHDYIVNGGAPAVPVSTVPPSSDSAELGFIPIRIDPTEISTENKIFFENTGVKSVEKKQNIIEHKLDGIFHDVTEHVEHL